MKHIKIYSHRILNKFNKPIKLENGDLLDSQILLYGYNNTLLFEGVCNVDSSNNYDNNPEQDGIQKIEIEDGCYYGIVGLHKNKYKAILLLNSKPRPNAKWQEYNIEKYRTLNTIQYNYLHKKNIAKFINIHKCSMKWDYSAGCITLLDKDFETFMSFFELNEICSIEKIKKLN